MQIAINLPDNLPLTEADVRIELAILSAAQPSRLKHLSAIGHHFQVFSFNFMIPTYR